MLALLVLLALAEHVLLPQLATLEAGAEVLRHMRWWAVALAVATQGVSYWANGYTIQSVARLTGDRLGTLEAIGLALAAGSVGLLTGGPVGYGAASYHWTRNRGMSQEGAVICGWLPGILNAGAMIALAAVGIVFLVFHHVLGRSQLGTLGTLGMLGALVATIIVGGGLVLARKERVARVLRAWSRLRRRRPNPASTVRTLADEAVYRKAPTNVRGK